MDPLSVKSDSEADSALQPNGRELGYSLLAQLKDYIAMKLGILWA